MYYEYINEYMNYYLPQLSSHYNSNECIHLNKCKTLEYIFHFFSTYANNDDNKRVYSVFPALNVLPQYVCIFLCIRTRNPIPLKNCYCV